MTHSPAPKKGPKAPKPRKPIPKRSAKKLAADQAAGRPCYSTVARATKKIPRENVRQRNKRAQRNKNYYQSAEWRQKKAAVHERDGYRCVETVREPNYAGPYRVRGWFEHRCDNRGEIINGKQTAKGLVCEETSYGHRGIPGRIDTCKTRCRSCDRKLTPLERANHAQGFRVAHVGGEA